MPSSASGRTAFYTCIGYTFRPPFEVILHSLNAPKFMCTESLHQGDKAPITFNLHWERKGRGETRKKKQRENWEKKERKNNEEITKEKEFKPDLWIRTFYSSLTKGLSTWESQGKGSGSVNFQHTFFQQTKLTCPTGALSAHSASTGGVSAEQLACCKFTP